MNTRFESIMQTLRDLKDDLNALGEDDFLSITADMDDSLTEMWWDIDDLENKMRKFANDFDAGLQ